MTGTNQSSGFLVAMQRALRGKPQLVPLSSAVLADFTNGLIAAWARVCDVLQFYRDRLADEGDLATARQPQSVLWLAELAGAQRAPAIAAHVDLAITLIDAPGQPDRTRIGPGRELVVQTVPQNNQLPVVFETDAPLDLRTAWNAIALVGPAADAPAMIWPGCRSLRLMGVHNQIRPDDILLIGVALPGGPASSVAVRVGTVQSDLLAGATLVCWDQGLPDLAPPGGACRVVTVHLLKQRAGLFGRNAQAWADVPLARRNALAPGPGGVLVRGVSDQGVVDPLWRQAALPDPSGTVRVLMPGPYGTVLAGTSTGLWQRAPGAGWTTLALPPGRPDIVALAMGPTGDGVALLYAGAVSGQLFRSDDGGACWTVVTARVMPPAPPSGIVTTIGSLLRRTPPARPVATTPLPPANALLVVVGEHGQPARLFAGTDQGVYALDPSGAAWHAFNSAALPGFDPASGAAGLRIAALALFKGRLVAATAQGLFATDPATPGWAAATGLPPAPVAALAIGSDGVTLFAGTQEGIVASPDLAQWLPFNRALGQANPAISSLATHRGRLFAATDTGLFVSPDHAPGWQALARQCIDLFASSAQLAPRADDRAPGPALIARFARAGISFAATPTLTGDDIAAGETAAWLIDDAPGARRFRLALMAQPGAGLHVGQIVDVAAGPLDCIAVANGVVHAATAVRDTIAAQWPDVPCADDTVVLDRAVDLLRSGDRFVLIGSDPAATVDPVVRTIASVTTAPQAGFGRQSLVTRLGVAADPGLFACDPRQTRLYRIEGQLTACAPEPGEPVPPLGTQLSLAVATDGLMPGRRLMLTGPRAAAILLAKDRDRTGAAAIGWCSVAAAPELDRQVIGAAARPALIAAGLALSRLAKVAVLTPGCEWLLRDGDSAWRVHDTSGATPDDDRRLAIEPVTIGEIVDRPHDPAQGVWVVQADGQQRRVPADSVEVIWQAPLSSQQPVAQAATVAAIATAVNGASVTLALPLAMVFCATALRISANVACCWQGETVTAELLGQPASRPGRQGFRLQRAPLAHWAGPVGSAPRPMLHVAVNATPFPRRRAPGAGAQPGETWHPVASLDHAGPDDRVFEVVLDSQGGTTLWFGDGHHGAALPPGHNNVQANYRVGGGAAGNVAAGTLCAVRKRVAGIRQVTNPLAATGGVDAEPIDALRLRAPRRLQASGRIVTLGDYASFAEAFPGVARARADLHVAADGGHEVWLNVLASSSTPDPALTEALRAAILAARADSMRLRLIDAQVVHFAVRIVVGSTGKMAADNLQRSVRDHLLTWFSATRRAIGADVAPDEVIAAVRACPGVTTVSLAALHHLDQPAPGAPALLVAQVGGPVGRTLALSPGPGTVIAVA
jgi:predicted phage baseplate assembly protein